MGPLGVNAYLLADPVSKDACLIDPGADADRLKDCIKKHGFNLRCIINTHGHGDHIGANASFKVPIYVHEADKDFLADPDKNMSRFFFFNIISPPAERLLKEGDIIEIGSIKLKVIHTPGHTPGSIALATGNVIFTGDTLFKDSVGRTDFDYGSSAALFDSIRKKLLVFSDETVIYPGHGAPSTIGDEKKGNQFLA